MHQNRKTHQKTHVFICVLSSRESPSKDTMFLHLTCRGGRCRRIGRARASHGAGPVGGCRGGAGESLGQGGASETEVAVQVWMGKSWENHGKIIGKLENSWENPPEMIAMEVYRWETHGKTEEKIYGKWTCDDALMWKSLGRICRNMHYKLEVVLPGNDCMMSCWVYVLTRQLPRTWKMIL